VNVDQPDEGAAGTEGEIDDEVVWAAAGFNAVRYVFTVMMCANIQRCIGDGVYRLRFTCWFYDFGAYAACFGPLTVEQGDSSSSAASDGG
jgi:hypothetical protein